MTDTVKYVLDEEAIPKSWYNIIADLPEPPVPAQQQQVAFILFAY